MINDISKKKISYTVEFPYFEVIRIKKGLRIIQNSNYQNAYSKRIFKKMWMTDQKCCTSVQGGGGGPNPFLSCSLIADSCEVGTHTQQNHLPRGA